MKKLILGFAAVAGIATAANAQIKVAPEVGVNLPTMVNEIGNERSTSGMGIGLKAGVMVEIPISGGFAIEPGVMYSGKGSKNTWTALGITNESTIRTSYIEVPLNLKYTYYTASDIGLFGHVGPYFAYGIGGTQEIDNSVIGTVKNDIKFGSGNNEWNPMDVGMNIGVGVKIPMGLYFRAQYGMGFVDIDRNDNTVWKNGGNVGLSVGFQF